MNFVVQEQVIQCASMRQSENGDKKMQGNYAEKKIDWVGTGNTCNRLWTEMIRFVFVLCRVYVEHLGRGDKGSG